MKHCLTVLIFVAFPGLSYAAVYVESGEHPGYSRVVMQFERSPNWTFGRVADGYELRISDPETEFDVSDVFDRIPRTRLNSLTTPVPGRMTFGVGCDCYADVFEISPGRLVVDIKSGAVGSDSRFESWLEPEIMELPEDPNIITEMPVPVIARFPPDLPTDLRAAITALPPDHSMNFAQTSRIRDALRQGESGQADWQLVNDTEIQDAEPVQTARSGDQKPKLDLNRRLGDSLETALTDYNDSRTNEMERTLVEQLGRAAAQGLIEPTLTELLLPFGGDAQDNNQASEPTGDPRKKRPVIENGPNLRVETAYDRDAPQGAGRQSLTDIGVQCTPDDALDVASWGIDGQTGLAGLRASLLGEFDRPNVEQLEALAKRYVYLGFGAEALSLMNGMNIEFPSRDQLMALAQVVDGKMPKSPHVLSGQNSCPTHAAMWSVLADPSGAANVFGDGENVLRTFSGLPVHLRRHLGPRLSNNFLQAGNAEIATTLRNMIGRIPGDQTVDFGLLEARLNVDLGNDDLAIQQLRDLIPESGAQLAPAVSELIDTTLNYQGAIDKNTAELAEALAYEHRGTPIGRNLATIAIRGIIDSGEYAKSFNAIRVAMESGDFSASVATALLAEAQLQNAQNSDDLQFLKIGLANPMSPEIETPAYRAARHAVAKRLIDLGFTDDAMRLFNTDQEQAEQDEKLLLARAMLGQNQPQRVPDIVTVSDGLEAQYLLAQAYEKMGQFAKSHDLQPESDDPLSSQSVAWRSGDWTRITQAYQSDPESVQLAAARHAMKAAPLSDMAATAANTEGSVNPISDNDRLGSATVSLSDSTKQIAHSQEARRLIQALLE